MKSIHFRKRIRHGTLQPDVHTWDGNQYEAMSPPPGNRRCLVYHSSSIHGRLPEHVVFALKGLSPFYETMVLICDAALPEDDSLGIRCADLRTVVSNQSNPYFAWASFILGWDPHWAAGYDAITFTHSEVFGPLCDLHDFFREMESRDADYWGITNRNLGSLWGNDSRAFGRSRSRLTGIRPVECYFITFNKRVFTDASFRKLWSGMPVSTNQFHTEWRIARKMRRRGFKGAVLLDVETLENAEWFLERMDAMLDRSAPFIPTVNFRYYHHPQQVWRHLSDSVGYPTGMLQSHLSRTWLPHDALGVLDKKWNPFTLPDLKEPSGLTVAVHIHVFYMDVFQEILENLHRTGIVMDALYTTPLAESEDEIARLAGLYSDRLRPIGVRVFENRGRDILPWLKTAPSLDSYDVVGHFHTKRSAHLTSLMGEQWMEHIRDTMIAPLKGILAGMRSDPAVGIVIPDIHSFGRWQRSEFWKENEDNIRRLLSELGIDRSVQLPEAGMDMVFPHGNMFWYRPEALAGLIMHGWDAGRFPEEPAPIDGSLLHALERIHVYVAWSKGFDFRIMLNPGNQVSVWELHRFRQLSQ